MIGILDYRAGNVFSVSNALKHLGFPHRVISHPAELAAVRALIFPGVGQFASAMSYLRQGGWLPALKEFLLDERKPFLGICLGMQLLFSRSEEGHCPGLDLFPEAVVRFPRGKVPLIGWNAVAVEPGETLFRNISAGSFFYFVHSYHLPCSEAAVAWSEYHVPYVAAIHRDNICAVQFHPEKSGEMGLRLLKNWSEDACSENYPLS